jgi:hypothetical protein
MSVVSTVKNHVKGGRTAQRLDCSLSENANEVHRLLDLQLQQLTLRRVAVLRGWVRETVAVQSIYCAAPQL